MKLNNPDMIKQAEETTVREVEVLYWILETALDDGDTKKAEAIFEYLAYLGRYNQTMIRDGLHSPQRDRLKEISHELYGNGTIKKQPHVTMMNEIRSCQIPFKTEKELSDYLLGNQHLLSEAFGGNIKITGREVELKNDYRCDIVAESKTKFYPIELKIAQSTHAVVSQCSKYCYYFYRKLRYDHFKHIQGIVVSNGFDAWSVNAIRQEGHWICTIIPTDDSNIRLERIH